MIEVNEKIAIDHGLKKDEYKKICELLKRNPNLTELGIFSAMWNEHCSYKSSKKHLKKLNTKGKKVIQGPGENAGVIDIGDDDAIVFKIESHNHPSFIEPYQGAATGVGGILRDVFTMGARPIANLNSIHFGSPSNKKTKSLLRGVVQGIGGYGNCIGVPTIAGQTSFDESYNGNILVNAMTLGLVKKDKIFYSKAAGLNKPVIYVGSKTGRDGIHGASMASAKFDDKIEEKKPTVQVGDPFTEKLLLEACLELMRDDSIIAIQDMGAAGLTSSSVEMASKGKLGIELHLDKVPCREENMSPYEIMLSESQERMLIVLENGKEKKAKEIFDKWNLDFSVIGKTTNSKNIELYFDKNKVANIPIDLLSEEAPEYDKDANLPGKLYLSGTPLDATLFVMRDLLNDFQYTNNLDIVSFVCLTDGQSHSNFPSGTVLVDRKINQTFQLSKNYGYRATKGLLKWIKATTNARTIGYFLTDAKGRRVEQEWTNFTGVSEYDWEEQEKRRASFNKDGCILTENCNYDLGIVINSRKLKLNYNEDVLQVGDDATKGQLKRALVKTGQQKVKQRIILNKFVQQMAV